MSNQTSDVKYWNDYYKKDLAPKPPSGFAKFSFDYMERGKMLIDLGCGNGRDSMYFAENGIKVTAVDSSQGAIDSVDKSLPILAICDNFENTKALRCINYDYAYARWTIHAVTQLQQDMLLPNVYDSLVPGGLFFSETRTINDAIYGHGEPRGEHEFIADNHYRRFLDPDAFLIQLKDIGFTIDFFEESDEFSRMGDNSPMLMRIIARK